MKSIPVSKTTWRKLKKIKKKKGFRVLNQVVGYLADKEENETLPAGEVKEEIKPKNITPVAPESTLSDIYKVKDDLEKERRDLEKLRDEIRYEEARTENVCATEELRSAITNEIHAQKAYEDAKRKMEITMESTKNEMVRVHSRMDEIKQLIDHFELKE